MTIRATCKCGKQVQTRDENAGKRMKCPGCGSVVVMPAATPKTVPAPAKQAPAVDKPATVAFSCDCGKQLHARAEMAGKRTKCPACGAILTIPHAESPPTEDFEPPPEPEVRTTRAPKPAVKPSPFEDEDEPQEEEFPARRGKKPTAVEDDEERDEEEEEARPSRKRKKSKAPLLIGAILALLVLGGGAFAGWYFFLREPEPTKKEIAKGGPGGNQGSQRGEITKGNGEQPAVNPGDGSAVLDLVPRDAVGFLSVRVGDWWNSDFGKKAQQQLAQAQPGGVEQMQKELGLAPGDIEQLVVVLADTNMQAPKVWALVSTSKPYDSAKLLASIGPGAAKKEINGKTYYEQQKGPQAQAVHFVNDHLILGGTVEGVKDFLGRNEKPKADGPLSGAVKLAGEKHHVVLGVNVPPGQLQALGQLAGPQLKPFEALLELQAATITATIADDLLMDIHLNFPDDAKAKKAEEAIKTALTFAQLGLGQVQQDPAKAGVPAEMVPALNAAAALLQKLPVEQKGAEVQLTIKTEGGTLAKALNEAVPKVQGAAKRTIISNNLRQLGMAMHGIAATYNGQMPPAAIHGKDGKPLLSWRVAILPYIEQETLYKQFKLDEPWDSPNNIKLLAKMPKIYAPAIATPKDASSTYFQVFTGPMTPFADKPDGSPPYGAKGPHLPRTFADGTSNTILIVEAGEAVPWTKPEDIVYDPAKPLPKLGGDSGGDSFFVAMADGSVRAVKKTVSEQTLRAAITPAGGEILGKDW